MDRIDSAPGNNKTVLQNPVVVVGMPLIYFSWQKAMNTIFFFFFTGSDNLDINNNRIEIDDFNVPFHRLTQSAEPGGSYKPTQTPP